MCLTQLFKDEGHEVSEASRSTNSGVDFTNPAAIDEFYSQLDEVDAIVTAAGDAAFVSA